MSHHPRQCACGCGQDFVPSHGAQRFTRACAARRQKEHWQTRRARGYQPPRPKPTPPQRAGKPYIGAVAPDFQRLWPELKAEFERVDVNRYDIVRQPVKRQERSA